MALAAASCLTLFAASTPGFQMSVLGIALVLWLVLLAGWFVTLANATSRPQSLSTAEVWSFAAIPIVVALVAALVLSGASLDTRFKLSRNVMTTDARSLLKKGASDEPEQVGSYTASLVSRGEDTLWFLIEGSGLLKQSGFLYSEDGRPTQREHEGVNLVRRLNAHWWTITENSW